MSNGEVLEKSFRKGFLTFIKENRSLMHLSLQSVGLPHYLMDELIVKIK